MGLFSGPDWSYDKSCAVAISSFLSFLDHPKTTLSASERVFGAVSKPARNAAGAISIPLGGRSLARTSKKVLNRTWVKDW